MIWEMESNLALDNLVISQIDAASYTKNVLNNLPMIGCDPSLIAVKETDIFRLRRGLCLPSAAAVCIDTVLEKRLIGDSDGAVKVGDFFRLVLPFHNRRDLVDENGNKFEKPFWVVTPEGDVYHHAIISFSEGLGVPARAISDFTISDLLPFIEKGGKLALSLNNDFVIEQTLSNDPDLVSKDNGEIRILIEGAGGVEYRRFEQGRHVVAILGEVDKHLIISDSFQLPNMKEKNKLLYLEIPVIEKYLKYHNGAETRAIAFAKERKQLDVLSKFQKESFIPKEIVDHVRSEINLTTS